MKLTIFAATGGIGSQLLEQARSADHKVTAVVRNPEKLNGLWSGLRVVTADLAAADRKTIEPAVVGADAVLSGLGASSNAEAGIATRGTRTIVDAIQASDVSTHRCGKRSAGLHGGVARPAEPTQTRSW